MHVTVHHPATGASALIHARTLPAWQRAGWTTDPAKPKRARRARRRPPTTTPPAADGAQDDSTAGPSTEPTKE